MVEARAKDTLHCWVDLGQQASDPVRCRGGLFGQVVVASEHGQFGELFVGDLDGSQGVDSGAEKITHSVEKPLGSLHLPWIPLEEQIENADYS